MEEAKRKSLRSKQKLRHSMIFFGDISLSNVIDWLVTFCLSGILVYMFLQTGGLRPETSLIATYLLSGLLLVHALMVINRFFDDGFSVNLGVLVFLPWFAYVLLQGMMHGGGSHSGLLNFALWVQMGIVLVVFMHGSLERRQTLVVIGVVVALGVYSLLLSFNQVFRGKSTLLPLFSVIKLGLFPNTVPELYFRYAVGSLSTPTACATYMAVLTGPLMTCGLLPGLNVMVRVFCGYAALMTTLCVVLTFQIPSICTVGVILAVVPLLTRPSMKLRIGYYVGLLVVALLLLHVAPMLIARVADSLSEWQDGQPTVTRTTVNAVAGEIFNDNKAMGGGPAILRRDFESYRPSGFNYQATHVYNDYMNLLAERGIIGTILLLGPLLFTLYWGMHGLAKLSSTTVEKSGKRRKGQRVVRPKLTQDFLILTIGVATLVAFLIQMFAGYALEIPAMLLLLALSVAAIYKIYPLKEFDFGNPVAGGMTWLGCAVAAAVLLPLVLTGPLVGSVYNDEGRRMMLSLRENLLTVDFKEQELLNCEEVFNRSLEFDESQSNVWYALGEVSLLTAYRDPIRREEVGRKAENFIREGFVYDEKNAWLWIGLGQALWMQGDMVEAGKALEKATELAPNLYQSWYYYGAYLDTLEGDDERAMEAVARCVELAPEGNELVTSLMRKVLIVKGSAAEKPGDDGALASSDDMLAYLQGLGSGFESFPPFIAPPNPRYELEGGAGSYFERAFQNEEMRKLLDQRQEEDAANEEISELN